MNEQKHIIDENTTVICPWCFNITEFNSSEEGIKCKVCAREISITDLAEDKDQFYPQ